MSWRTVVISSRAKLDLELNHLVVRQTEKKTKVFIEEIAVLIIESTAISLTAALLNELTKQKVKVVFCDEKRNPSSELIPHYGSHDTSNKVVDQVSWDNITKQVIWTEIVRNKIIKQANLLQRHDKDEVKKLYAYVDELELNDASNREGHAAKVYFNALFGKGFSRGQDNAINACLNYGYGLLLSTVNREISMNGYLTQIGIFHRSKTNPFNLGSDLMEPWRPIIDEYVYAAKPEELTPDVKQELISLLHQDIKINNKMFSVLDGIKIYVKSCFDALNNQDISYLRIYEDGD